ncbi:nucleotidyl transferase AbiEii/AbiGii toxin family protein [Candidatus Aerophobetes bacterium]|nr:nucleotidyl transferase AbiEii/AbiGii toxin family protein [Candidatus Aerophobetes bacterium]
MDLRELQKIQRETGFNPGFIEKVYQLTRILAAIYSDKDLKENLTLKGGTGLNFVYLNIPRLSVDLDFNFIGAVEKDKILKLRPAVTRSIKAIANNLGLYIFRKSSSYIFDRFLIRYRSLRGLQESIRIEINYLERVPVVTPAQKIFRHSGIVFIYLIIVRFL